MLFFLIEVWNEMGSMLNISFNNKVYLIPSLYTFDAMITFKITV